MKTTKVARLLGSVSVAAFVYAGAVAAQTYELDIEDYAYFGDTYENWTEVNFDYFDDDIIITSTNAAISEGAIGATNTGVDQVAIAQFVTVAEQTDSANDTLIDLSHDFSNEDEYFYMPEMVLAAGNFAGAHTTTFDAILGGSQVAMVGFNTASLDIVADGEDGAAEVALLQEIDTNWYYAGEDGYGMEFSAANVMDAATAYAGTATIDSKTWDDDANDGDGDYVNGIQQAVVSVNTFSLTSEVDTTIELAGQQFDTDDITWGYYGEDSVEIDVSNTAVAYSPKVATDAYVDPRLAVDSNDPSISNLDQVAAVSLNTMSFGNAANADEGIDASTADFTVYSYSNGYGIEANGQEIDFDNNTDELTFSNVMVATTDREIYEEFSDFEVYELGGDWNNSDGEGNVALDNVSQVVALTINSINSAGVGDLTLKEWVGGEDYIAGYQDDFDQDLDDLNYYAGSENMALAITDVGNADISGLDQVVQYSLNSIRSGGDLYGWNPGEDGGIEQWVDYDFYSGEDYGDYGPFGVIFDEVGGGINTALAGTAIGDTSVSDVTQVMQFSANTISVAGDIVSEIEQDNDDRDLRIDMTVNSIATAAYWNEDGASDVSIDTAEQVALFSFNTVSAGGAIDTYDIDQDFEAEDMDIDAPLNLAFGVSIYGDVGVSGLDQTAQLVFNTIAADSFTGYIDQEFEELDSNAFGEANIIAASSLEQGDASIADSSQTFILNANSVRTAGALNGTVYQDVDDIRIDYMGSSDYFGGGLGEELGAAVNVAYAWADQDVGDSRWAGGNASINGLTQTLSMNFNSVSAGSLDGAYIRQYAEDIEVSTGNYAYADAEWGAATMTGVSQTTINRINSISITPVSN